MVKENSTSFLKASSPGQRIVKRSIDLDECYHAPTEDEYLEVAANVVFERLRRNADDNEIIDGQANGDVIEQNKIKRIDDNNNGEARKVYDLENNRVRKRRAPSNEENTSSGDLRYEQLVFEDDASDPNAKIIDFEALQRKNRPADVLEYKRFLKVSNVAPFMNSLINRNESDSRYFFIIIISRRTSLLKQAEYLKRPIKVERRKE